MQKRCFIVGAGEYSSLVTPDENDYIIAADGGYAELDFRGITPNLVVGDFDSLGELPNHPNIIQSPVEKDDTDMMTAVKAGISRGFVEFIIDGALGGRLDHTIANIQTLVYLLHNKAKGYLLGRDMSATAISNGSIAFTADAIGRVSVFSISGNAQGVTISGLKYPLDNGTLAYDYPLGVSNEFIGKTARISVKDGILLVMWTGGMDAIGG